MDIEDLNLAKAIIAQKTEILSLTNQQKDPQAEINLYSSRFEKVTGQKSIYAERAVPAS